MKKINLSKKHLPIVALYTVTALTIVGGLVAKKIHDRTTDPIVVNPVNPILPGPKEDPIPSSARESGQVEVVFVLDTTSSMSGMIQAAKQKIWSIASTLGSARQNPNVKIGLVAFRDRGDDYVTQVFDLTSDLDSMYGKLMGFQAQGGGDGPESVNQALNEAVTRMSWSKDAKTYRVIFLVGDAPPHMDYQNDVPYTESIAQATKKGIVVNTIQCGEQYDTQDVWKSMASLSQGRYFRVDQGGGALVAHTPYDEEIARLSSDLEGTRLAYGSREDFAEADKKSKLAKMIAGSSDVVARAARGAFAASKSGAANFLGSKELVNDVAEKKVDIKALPASALPAPMQALSVSEREAFVQKNLEKRNEIQKKIVDLSNQRQEHLKKEAAKAGGAKDSLDEQLYGTIKGQAAKKGLTYTSGPTY